MLNWSFLTTGNDLVSLNFKKKITDINDCFKYLNGQTALDWIRMGYLNELIARDLPTP